MSDSQQRIIELQRQVKIARHALAQSGSGCSNPEQLANDTLDSMWPLERKQPLQKLVGHQP
jgi:hypothetical protein